MKLANNFSIDPIQYATQGNAILGIKESGKTYTATAIAEKLLDSGIPFIAFDPIGIWKNLKIGVNGPGYPVVVAGEHGDLELTVESAPRIVRAAMQSNISLVIDLYSMQLSKADWRRIVQECLQLLLYENKPHGLRHVFLEEAAEFCPQRVGPESGRVYAEVEKLARMGGNASLGYTLINQRAEEVNKAVLELCDCLFLHRQKGRHSLTALGKWMDVADVTESREIIKSLPTLQPGHCWVWEQGSQAPLPIHVLPKKTVHPDRRHPLAVPKGNLQDVTTFVSKMQRLLMHDTVPTTPAPKNQKKQTVIKTMPLRIQEKPYTPVEDPRVGQLQQELSREKARNILLNRVIEDLRKALKPQYDALRGVFEKIPETGTVTASSGAWDVWLGKLTGKNRLMLEVLIETKSLTRQQLAFQTGQPPNSGTFARYLSRLKSLGLTEKNGDQIRLKE